MSLKKSNVEQQVAILTFSGWEGGGGGRTGAHWGKGTCSLGLIPTTNVTRGSRLLLNLICPLRGFSLGSLVSFLNKKTNTLKYNFD